jgi:seryl-tRNA synthetase
MNIAVSKRAKAKPVKARDPLDHLAAALFRPMGSDGVYARSALYEDVIERLAGFISRQREPQTEILRFPPVMSRAQLETAGYLKSFPNLLGCVCALHGSEADIRGAAARHEAGGDWTSSLSAADLVLTPAACYPVYPLAAARGPVPKGGLRFDVASDCFRHEPSKHLDRLQSFRMREYVCIGSPSEAADFRDRWMKRAEGLADELGLAYKLAPASDPFFGRTGQVMAVSQLQQALKFELMVPLRSAEQATACMSFNCHRDHFGTIWGLRDEAGAVAHTACAAFGMDRLAVALFFIHGLEPQNWPAPTRRALAI